MEERKITNEMRRKINDYLGYELIKNAEVGLNIFDEAPGLGKIGIEGGEHGLVITNKQLDSNGNVEWFKSRASSSNNDIKAFHCKLTTVSSKKAKILIASLFPEEEIDSKFLEENTETIENLRKQLHIVKKSIENIGEEQIHIINKLIFTPRDAFFNGALHTFSETKMVTTAFI